MPPGHTVLVEKLPLIHCDPFDRLLIAQATTEMMLLLTADTMIEKYNSPFVLSVR